MFCGRGDAAPVAVGLAVVVAVGVGLAAGAGGGAVAEVAGAFWGDERQLDWLAATRAMEAKSRITRTAKERAPIRALCPISSARVAFL